MTKTRALLLFSLTMILVGGSASILSAAGGDFYLEVPDEPSCNKGYDAHWDGVFTPNWECPTGAPKFTITPYGAGSAHLDLGNNPDDPNYDVLRLTNAKITAMTTLNNFHVRFRREHTEGPKISDGPQWYRIVTRCSLTAGAMKKVVVTASVENPLATPQSAGGPFTLNPGNCGAGAPSVPWTSSNLTGNRLLEIDLELYLVTGNVLNIPINYYIQLQSQPYAFMPNTKGGKEDEAALKNKEVPDLGKKQE